MTGTVKLAYAKPRYLALIALLAAGLAYVYWPEQTRTSERRELLAGIPKTIGEWTVSEERTIPDDQLASLGAAEYVLRTYRRGGEEILLYAAFFTGKHGSLTHNPEKCYPAVGFTVTRSAAVSFSGADGDVFRAVRIVPARDEERLVVLYWFQEGDRVIVNKWEHILKVLMKAILYNRTESLMVRLSIPYTTEEALPAKTLLLQEFGDQLRHEIGRTLQGNP